jgi:hypothetical protein
LLFALFFIASCIGWLLLVALQYFFRSSSTSALSPLSGPASTPLSAWGSLLDVFKVLFDARLRPFLLNQVAMGASKSLLAAPFVMALGVSRVGYAMGVYGAFLVFGSLIVGRAHDRAPDGGRRLLYSALQLVGAAATGLAALAVSSMAHANAGSTWALIVLAVLGFALNHTGNEVSCQLVGRMHNATLVHRSS